MEFLPSRKRAHTGIPPNGKLLKINFKVDLKSKYVKSSQDNISRLSLEPSSIHFGSPIFVGWTPWNAITPFLLLANRWRSSTPLLGPQLLEDFWFQKPHLVPPKTRKSLIKSLPPKKKLSLQLSWCAFSQLIFSYPRFCFVTLTQEEQGWKLGCTQGFPGEGGCIITWVHRFTCIRACVCLLCSRCKICSCVCLMQW